MDEVIWVTFEERTNELLSYGYSLSHHLQLRAISKVEGHLAKWKHKLRIPLNSRLCSSHIENDDGKQFEAFNEHTEGATPERVAQFMDDQDWNIFAPGSERNSQTVEHIYSTATLTDVCRDNQDKVSPELPHVTQNEHSSSHAGREKIPATSMHHSNVSGIDDDRIKDSGTYTEKGLVIDVQDNDSDTDDHSNNDTVTAGSSLFDTLRDDQSAKPTATDHKCTDRNTRLDCKRLEGGLGYQNENAAQNKIIADSANEHIKDSNSDDRFVDNFKTQNQCTESYSEANLTVSDNNATAVVYDGNIEDSVMNETCDVLALSFEKGRDYTSESEFIEDHIADNISDDSDVGDQGKMESDDDGQMDKEHKKPSITRKHKKKGKIDKSITTCDLCDESFSTHSNMNSHKTLHGKGPFRCIVCEKMYETGIKLRKHVVITHSQRIWKCGECDKEYKSAGGLSIHKQIHNPTKQCPHCEHKAPNSSYLKIHIDRTHFRNDVSLKSHICHKCGMRFYRKSQLTRHFLTHIDVKSHLCPHCDHSTTTEGLLRTHIRNIHTETDPFVCNICGATTKFKSSMEQHQRRHRNERPYKCDECPYAAVSSSHIAQHKMIHRAPGFECDVCGKKFIYRGQLKRHNVIHTGQKEFSCTQCNYSCNVPSNLKKHERQVHKL